MATAQLQHRSLDAPERRSVPPSWVKDPRASKTQEIPLVQPTEQPQNGHRVPPSGAPVSSQSPSQSVLRPPSQNFGHRSVGPDPDDPRRRTQEIPLNQGNAPPAGHALSPAGPGVPHTINGSALGPHSPSRASPSRSAVRPFTVASPTAAAPLRLNRRFTQTQEIPLSRPQTAPRPEAASIHNDAEMMRLQRELKQASPPPPAFVPLPRSEPPQPAVRIPVEQIPLNFASIHPDATRQPGTAGGMSAHNAAWLAHERADAEANRQAETQVRSSWDVAGRLRQGFDYIGETPLTLKEAARVYLLRPKPPHGPDKRERVAQMLGKEYGVPPAVIWEIWDAKRLPGSGEPLPLDSWQTEGLPPWLPGEPPHAEPSSPETQRVYRTAGPLTQPSEEAMARARRHALPAHRLLKRAEGKTTNTVCERVEAPPSGMLDVLVVEACNLPVPHKFASVFDTGSIRPYAQVQLLVEGPGGEPVRDWLKTSTMDRALLENWRRSPLDPVFNQTLRFPGIIDGGEEEKREVVLTVHDSGNEGAGGTLGQWRVPLKALFDGAFGIEGWVDLRDEHGRKVEGFNRGKRCAVLVRAICRPLPHSVHEARKAARQREAEIKADEIFRREAARIRILEEKQRREEEEEEERMRQEQHSRIQAAMETAKRRQEEEAEQRRRELEAEAERLQSQERVLAMEAEQAVARQRLAAEEARAREAALRVAREREAAEFALRVEEEKERMQREVQGQALEDLLKKREQLLQIHQENERLESEIQRAAAATALQRQRLLEETRAMEAEKNRGALGSAPPHILGNATVAPPSEVRAGLPMGLVPSNSLHDPSAAPACVGQAAAPEEAEEEVDPEEVWKDPGRMLRLAGVEGWMEREDLEWVRSRPSGMALSRDFRLELVPGAVGALQGIAAEGYEVVLVGVAKPWLAQLVAEALRQVNVVGPRGVVKETNLLFCQQSPDKLRLARAIGKVVAAVDDEWGVLKALPSLGGGPALMLFNPPREDLSAFNEDERVWRTYKMGLQDAVRELSTLQQEATAMEKIKDVTDTLAHQHGKVLVQLREKENGVLPELQHLSNKEPRGVMAIHSDTLPPLRTWDGLQGRAAATAVEPWLRVAEALDVNNSEPMLRILRDAANPQRAEALARKLNDGTALPGREEPPPAPAPPADAPLAPPPQLPPFYPLQSAWHYPLEREAAEALPPAVKEGMMQRVFDWRASLQDYRLSFGIGIDFAIADDMLIVNKLLPCGPAMRSGMIEEGMRLAVVDGELVALSGLDYARRVLASRIIECEESRRGQCAKRLETFRHMPPEARSNLAGDPAELVECGFQLSATKQGEAVLRCQYCDVEVKYMPAGVNMWELHEKQSPYCPLIRFAGGHQPPPESDALPRPSCLSMGLTLGFVSPSVAQNSARMSKEEFEKSVQHVWVCPEPADDKLSATDKGRLLIDLSRVVLRLRYYETKTLLEREPFRDSRLDESVRVPLTALALQRNMDEVVDAEGRTVYVDHERKSTTLIPPRPFSPDVLPRDGDGRVYYANDEQCVARPQPVRGK